MISTEVMGYLPYVRRLQDEHRKISEVVEQIQAAHFPHGDPVSRRNAQISTDLLIEQLYSLRTMLRDHFEEETTGGCMEEAISRLPRLAADMGVLEADHCSLLEQLDGVIASVQHEVFTGRASETIERRFNDFAEMLYDHEADENRLLEQGFNVGSEDIY